MKLMLDELEQFLSQGREIEFRLNLHNYYVSMVDDNSISINEFYIWDDDADKLVIKGDMNAIINYEFKPNVRLLNCIDSFDFKYIL